jgi:hypothetical protein
MERNVDGSVVGLLGRALIIKDLNVLTVRPSNPTSRINGTETLTYACRML